MNRLFSLAFCLLICCCLVCSLGCNNSSSDKDNKEKPKEKEDAHAEELGPEGGHLIELGEEEYHIEWTHEDDEGLLSFFIRDAEAKELVPIEGDLVLEMELDGEDGEKQTLTKTADPLDRTDESPKTAKFEIADKPTMVNVLKVEKVKTTIKVTINEKDFSAEIEHQDHHGHSHGPGHSH